MLILTEIWIYPIKSLGGIRLDQSEVLGKGLRYDRRWMLVDGQNRFFTQREFPDMALFTITQHGSLFTITFKNESLLLDSEAAVVSDPIECIVWNDSVLAHEVSPAHSSWISERLGTSCKLVAFPEKNPRPVPLEYSVNNESVSLADGYPVLILGQSSLDELNNRLPSPILMNRFRPNFVFTGAPSFAEDEWKEFSIGEVKFKVVKPCIRCVMTLVNQETAALEKEPLRTLATFREFDKKIRFGMNVLVLTEGQVKEKDLIRLN